MSMHELVSKTRSYRRFTQEPISDTTLRALVDLARLSPSGGNLQPLKFILSNTPERNAAIFPNTVWAGYLTDWPGPDEGERPMAYVVILTDTAIRPEAHHDVGIAAQSIVLGAMDQGIGACMIGSIKKEPLRAALHIPAVLDISLIIALGKPAETVVLECLPDNGSIKYYRTPDGFHHVPKRSLDDLIVDFE